MSEFTHKAAGVAPNAVPAAAQDTAPAFPIAPEAPFATAPDIAPAFAVRGTCDRAFERRDWAVVALALLEALLCSAVFWPADLLRGLVVAGFAGRGLLGWLPLPGVGLSLAMLGCIGALFAAVGRKARLDRTTVPLIFACVAMSLMPAIFADGTLRALNCLVLWPTWTLTAFLVSGLWPDRKASARAQARSVARFFSALFSNLMLPVREARIALGAWKLSRQQGGNPQRAARRRAVAAGVAAAACLLAVALPLLASADEVFGSLFGTALSQIASAMRSLASGDAFWRAAMVCVTGPFLFALLWGFAGRDAAAEPEQASAQEPVRRLHPVTVAIAIGALDVAYALFAVVQFVYLFGGAESAAMAGGYAEYARAGFFQLVAVAAVNIVAGLCAIEFTATRLPEALQPDAPCAAGPSAAATAEQGSAAKLPLAVRVLVWALVVLTFVILASALWRMLLYIGAFGLTLLRCLTLLGMAFACVLLAVLAVKAGRPQTSFFRVFLAAGLGLWIAFNVANVDAIMANYNVDAYLSGQTNDIDIAYLTGLSPSADPALERLVQEAPAAPHAPADIDLVKLRLAGSADAAVLSWQMQCAEYWLHP